MKQPTTIVAILCLTLLEVIAIVHHIDGTTFLGVATIIGGLGGYAVCKARTKTPPPKS